jgi:tRNA threonylcarbamoyladenosine biosynthesis protein TsaE
LENFTALKAIGFQEYIFGDGVSIIEWADRFPSAIPGDARWIRFHMISPYERTIELE